jgi:hypothetical protein
MGPALGNPSGTWNFEVASSFMEDLWTLDQATDQRTMES